MERKTSGKYPNCLQFMIKLSIEGALNKWKIPELAHVFCNVRKLINKNNAMTLDFMLYLEYNAKIARI